MKNFLFISFIIGCALLVPGCKTNSGSSNISTQIRQDAINLSKDIVQANIDACNKAIAEKTSQLVTETKKLTNFSVVDQFSEEAQKTRQNITAIKQSITNLKTELNHLKELLRNKQ